MRAVTTKSEMTWKLSVKEKYFADFAAEFDEKHIDFLIYAPQGTLFADAFLWAESKRFTTDVTTMFAQLILTIKKTVDAGDVLPPKFLGVFDREKFAFIEFHKILSIFNLNDFDWTEKPSSVSTKTKNTVANFLTKEALYLFEFAKDEAELKDFIKNNFLSGTCDVTQSQITKNNFITVYNKWVNAVRSTIAADFDELREYDVLDADFYLADLLSENNESLYPQLKISLRGTYYVINVDKVKRLLREVLFNDGGKEHAQFWLRYKRPPKEEFHEYMKMRRDLLVPQKIRERKGAYFTPAVWVEKAHEYLENTFGENWQDEFYIWDCCCGTANLLANLINADNVWASTIDQPDIDIIYDSIDHGFNLLKPHVFKFDFLNDSFDELPAQLKDVINDPEKQKKLILLINPPYAESGDGLGTGTNKIGVVSQFSTHPEFMSILSNASHEVFSQFIIQVYRKMPHANLAVFTTLKYLNSPNFAAFRQFFRAEYTNGFIVPANTFDNVVGQFPIGFLIWRLSLSEFPNAVSVDVIDRGGSCQSKKTFRNDKKLINEWLRTVDVTGNHIGFLHYTSNDFQNSSSVWIGLKQPKGHKSRIALTETNISDGAIYFAVRHCIPHTWINHNDQFLFPNDSYKRDIAFQKDCLVFALFHDKNTICAADGVNHWIPFTRRQINGKNSFKSTFMSDFLKTREPFTQEASAVLEAGRVLWQYYHAVIKNNDSQLNDASLYEIREYFKKRNSATGRRNIKAADIQFNELDEVLKESLNTLAKRIKPLLYTYGFLLE
jgi:hypothetical protein